MRLLVTSGSTQTIFISGKAVLPRERVSLNWLLKSLQRLSRSSKDLARENELLKLEIEYLRKREAILRRK